jgi:hypothetical protein
MALATLSIMQAVSGRLFLTAMLGGNLELTRPGMLPPPPLAPTMVPHLVFDLVILVIMTLHDRRRLGKIHWATLLGGGVILMVHSTRHLFGHSAAWRVVAEWLVAI